MFACRRSSYVSRGEGRYDSDDSGMSDFINDDSEEDEEEIQTPVQRVTRVVPATRKTREYAL